jgi:hypothetical protein
MRNSSRVVLAAMLAFGWPPTAFAQQAQDVRGFASERLYLSAPGSTWFAVDDLRWPRELSAAASLTLGYAHRPLDVQGLAVVRHQTFADFGLAVASDRFQFHAHFPSPVYVAGQSGAAGDLRYTAPSANVERNPDTISDARLGFAARLLGDPEGPLRAGASAELFFPSGSRADYSSDGSYRGVFRLVFAGDGNRFAWAGHAGVHLRSLDEAYPGSPRGSEALFALAGGARFPLLRASFLVGPEVSGATAFRSFFGSDTTELEALLTARFEGPGPHGTRLGLKAGAGAGLHPEFGAPRWRAVIGIELRGGFEQPNPAAAQ